MVNTSVSHNILEASRKIKSEIDQKIKMLKMIRAVQVQMKAICPVHTAFKNLDTNNYGYLTEREFHANFSNIFKFVMKTQELRALFREIDADNSGLIKFKELEKFYNTNYIQKLAQVERERRQRNTQNEIFDHLIKVLMQRGLTLQDCFDQIDEDKNGYIEVDEFHNMLERMGFTISQEQVYELLCRMDDNFDGKISYGELRDYIDSLGFDMKSLEERGDDPYRAIEEDTPTDEQEFMWRDKAIELLIRSVTAKLGKQEIRDYFSLYDDDHDMHLTPP